MRKKAILISLFFILLLGTMTVSADSDSEGVWSSEDFTYGEFVLNTTSGSAGSDALYPANDFGTYMLPGTKWVVTGFSESGAEKLLAGNKDLVLPSVDPDGRAVQGVGSYAFKPSSNPVMSENNIKITSVKFPENIKTTENVEDVNNYWGSKGYLGNGKLTELGDYYIGYGAFDGNALTDLTIPEGTIYLNTYAFARNSKLKHVKLPSTLAIIGTGAFYNCSISSVEFSATTDIRLNIYNQAFCDNKIAKVDLPRSTLMIGKWAFLHNTGSGEPVQSSVSTEKNGEVVYMYMKGEAIPYYESQNIQKLVLVEDDEPEHTHVLVKHEGKAATCTEPGNIEYYECTECLKKFTDETAATEVIDTVIPAKGHKWDAGVITREPTEDAPGEILYTCENNPSHTRTEEIYPETEWTQEDFTYEGTAVTGLSEEGESKLRFNTDIEIPDESPDGTPITEIGDLAFLEKGITSVVYPAGLEKIGERAFAHTELSEAVIPDTVSEIGPGAYAMDWQLSKIVLPEGIETIPAGAFNRQTIRGDKYDNYPSVGEIVIPDSVTSIGQTAFFGLSATSVKLPSGLLEMGQSAFSNNKISKVDIPGTLKVVPLQAFSIGMAMFNEHVRITELVMHEGTESIGRNAFENSGLSKVYIPSTIKSIHDTAFRVGMGITPVEDKIILVGTLEQNLDETINTGSGYGHKFLPVITFDPNGHGEELQFVQAEEDFTIGEMPELDSEPCYKFSGWAKDASGEEKVAAGDEIKTSATLYAVWEETHDYRSVINKKPTATENGSITYTCTRDESHTYTEAIPHFTDEEIQAIEKAQDDLTEQVISANARLTSGSYTPESFKAARDAINKANEIFDDPTATEADIKAAKVELMRTLRTLEPVDQAAAEEVRNRNEATDTLAKTLIEVYKEVAENDYTASSYAVLKKAIANAEALLESDSADADTLSKANSAILIAWKDLDKKKAQPMTLKARTVKLKASKLKKKAQKVAIGKTVKVKKAKGSKSYGISKVSKSGAAKYFSIDKKNGKLTVKKGLKKGLYKVTVKVTAAGNGTYKAGSKTAVVKVRVR